MMGDKYCDIKNALKVKDIVEDDGKPIRNVKSTAYRLTEGYRNTTHRRHDLTGKVIVKRLQKHKDDDRGLWCPVHHHLCHWLSRVSLPLVDKRYKRQSLNITRIQDQDFFLRVDKYGRVHTNVTNLKTSLRKLLLVNNSRLVELDISNSQPLMFGMLLKSKKQEEATPYPTSPLCSGFLQNTDSNNTKSLNSLKELLPVWDRLRREAKRKQEGTTPYPTTPLCSGFLQNLTMTDDIDGYVRFCEQGQLYEAIMSYCDLPDHKRNKTKRRILSRVFYCRNREQDNDLSHAFGELFPTVLEAIKTLKRDDYRHLPRLMQRVEADYIIHRVCGTLMRDYPHVPVLTIHDCIMTTPEHVPLVKTLMMSQAQGIRPNIKIHY